MCIFLFNSKNNDKIQVQIQLICVVDQLSNRILIIYIIKIKIGNVRVIPKSIQKDNISIFRRKFENVVEYISKYNT